MIIFLGLLILGLLPSVTLLLTGIFMPVLQAAALLLIMPAGIALMCNAFSRELSRSMLRAEGRALRRILRTIIRILWTAIAAATVWLATLIFTRVAPAVFRRTRNLLLSFGRSRWFSNFIGGVVTALVVAAII